MSKFFPLGTKNGNGCWEGELGSLSVKFTQNEVRNPCVRAGFYSQNTGVGLIGFTHQITQLCTHGVAVDDAQAVNTFGECAQAAVYDYFCLITVFAVQVYDYGSGLHSGQLLLLEMDAIIVRKKYECGMMDS